MNRKALMGLVLFGSVWALIECSLGDWLHHYHLSMITASIAIILMVLTRYLYKQPGMQLGMAAIAALLRQFNPIGGCLMCASIAILMEGLAFELIWLIPWGKYQSMTMKVSKGIISFYTICAAGYISTHILTPLLMARFYISDLISTIPRVLASSTIAGIIGAFAMPAVYAIVEYMPTKIENKLYYGAASALSLICWLAVVSGI